MRGLDLKRKEMQYSNKILVSINREQRDCHLESKSGLLSPLAGAGIIFASHDCLELSRKVVKFHEVPLVQPPIFLCNKVVANSIDSIFFRLVTLQGWA